MPIRACGCHPNDEKDARLGVGGYSSTTLLMCNTSFSPNFLIWRRSRNRARFGEDCGLTFGGTRMNAARQPIGFALAALDP